MIPLSGKGEAHNIKSEIVVTVKSIQKSGTIICQSSLLDETILISKNRLLSSNSKRKYVIIDSHFYANLTEGDILLIKPKGHILSLFRSKSEHNSLFVTDRCNSNCLMCSQPPKNVDDLDYFYNLNSQLVKLIPKSTSLLGITGGEPLLLGERLALILIECSKQLPNTEIHVLTNGRAFAWKDFLRKFDQVSNKNIIYGIPIYSDYSQEHDYIVQSRNAFDQTMMGLYNVAKNNFRIEIRCVLHKLTYKRLPKLAQFIHNYLPFVEHIAFMGLEFTGYTIHNSELLWIEPEEYAKNLEEAVLYLSYMGMNVSIYNIPHCVLPPKLRTYSRKSISDWKREYYKECKSCSLLQECGGFFGTSKVQSKHIKAVH